MAEGWYYEKNDAELGPVPRAKLLQLIASGEVGRNSLVWTQGMGDWAPAANVKGLLPPKGPQGAKPPPPAAEAEAAGAAVAEAEAMEEPAGGLRAFWQNLSPAAKAGILAGGGGTALMFLAIMVLVLMTLFGGKEPVRPVAKAQADKITPQKIVSTEPDRKTFTLDPATLAGAAKTEYDRGVTQGTHIAAELADGLKGQSDATVKIEVRKALQDRNDAIQVSMGHGKATDPDVAIVFGRREGFKAELTKRKIPMPATR